MRRSLGLILTLLLIIGVGIAIYLSVQEQRSNWSKITIHGLIGSEKEEFFKDPRVLAALQRLGLTVQVEKAGSRQIATSFDLKPYDFVFTAGTPAAEKICRDRHLNQFFTPFFTPMAIASWQPIVRLLVNNGMAEDRGGIFFFKMASFLDAVKAQRRWKDLADNHDYAVNKNILITSTDVRKSNSAAMYLALASFVANGDTVVQSDADIDRVMPLLEKLFLQQGFMESSTEYPFEDYLVMGMGKSPLVMIYEAQFLQRAAAGDGSITSDMVLLYPEPTLYTKHVLVPLNEAGARLGEALTTDPELQRLAVEHGFRNQNIAYFRDFTRQHHVTAADTLTNVIDAPSYEVLERMIQRIEQRY